MSKLEKPSLKLNLELEVPDFTGGPPKRFVLSRTLKAKWDENPQNVTKQILEEIKNYKGSFIGDIIKSLNSVFYSNNNLTSEKTVRENDVARWTAQLIDSMIFSSIDDNSCVELMDNESISEWDGNVKLLEPIKSEELKNVDIEKVTLLLMPKIKHAMFLLSKKLNE